MWIKSNNYFMFFFATLLLSKYHVLAVDQSEIILNNLLSKWDLFENTAIIKYNKYLTINHLTTDTNIEDRSNLTSEFLSCKYITLLTKFVVLAQSAIDLCKEQGRNIGQTMLVNCTREIVKDISCATGSMAESIMSFFNEMPPNNTDNRLLYVALMDLKLYSDNKTHVILPLRDTRGGVEMSKINSELDKIDWLLASVNNKLQTHSIKYCLSISSPLPTESLDEMLKKHKMDQDTLDQANHEKITFTGRLTAIIDLELVIDELNRTLGFKYHEGKNAGTTIGDMKTVWQLIESQNLLKNPTAVLWSNESKTVSDIMKQVIIQQSRLGLATIQKLTLDALAEMFLKKMFYVIEDLCKTIRVNRSQQKNFLTNLKDVLFRFSFTRLCELLDCSKTLHEDMTLKNILTKLPVSVMPVNTVSVIVMLDKIISEKNITEQFENTCADIKRILTKELDVHTVNFADDDIRTSSADDYGEMYLDLLNEFVEQVMAISHSVERLTRSNSQLWHVTDFEKSALTHEVKPANGIVVKHVCFLTVQLIEFFTINYKLVDSCFTNPSVNCLKRINFVGKKLKTKFPSVLNTLFLLLHNAPKTENLNVRNAIVVIIMYLNNVRLGEPPYGVINDYLIACTQTDTKSMCVEHFKRLNLLIVNQLEAYAVNNCRLYRTASEDNLLANNATTEEVKQILLSKCDAITRYIRFKKKLRGTGSCDVDMDHASYASLVEGKRIDGSPLLGFDEMKFLWNGIHQTLKYIRKYVIFDYSPVMFAKYQTLVQNGVTAILFGYILNILKAITGLSVNFSQTDFSSIRLNLDKFENTVFSVSKGSAPGLVFKLLRLYLNLHLTYKDVVVFLIETIETQLKSFGIDLPAYYYAILNYNTVAYNVVQDVNEAFLKPLDNFVNRELAPFRKDFYCVAQYMMLHLN